MNRQFPSWDTVHIRGRDSLFLGIGILIPLYLVAPYAFVQFLCVALLVILIGSRLYSEYLVHNIRIIRLDSEFRVFRYDWVTVELRAENRGLLPAFMLVSMDSPGPLPVFKNNQNLCTLVRRSWMLLTWQGHCTDRGEFTLGPVVVKGADPLGLFPFQLTARETSRLFVYPVVRSLFLKNPKGIPLGNMITANPLFEDMSRRRSLRPYQKGDELRRINWKVSARMFGGFMVNEYDATAAYPLMIFLNVNHNDYPAKKRGDYIERVIEAAAALCLKAEYERQELGIILYTSGQEGGIAVIAPSAHSIVPILERLASLDWTAAATTGTTTAAGVMLDQGKFLRYGTRYLYVGPDLGDEAYISLNALKRYHLSLEYLVIDPRALPPLVPGNSPRQRMKEDGNEII